MPCFNESLYNDTELEKEIAKIKWTKGYDGIMDVWNYDILGNSHEMNEDFEVLENGSLWIKNVTSKYLGRYFCHFKDGQVMVQIEETGMSTTHIMALLFVGFVATEGLWAMGAAFVYNKLTKLRNKTKGQPDEENELASSGELQLNQETPTSKDSRCSCSCPPIGNVLKIGEFLVVNVFLCVWDVSTDVLQAIIHYR